MKHLEFEKQFKILKANNEINKILLEVADTNNDILAAKLKVAEEIIQFVKSLKTGGKENGNT